MVVMSSRFTAVPPLAGAVSAAVGSVLSVAFVFVCESMAMSNLLCFAHVGHTYVKLSLFHRPYALCEGVMGSRFMPVDRQCLLCDAGSRAKNDGRVVRGTGFPRRNRPVTWGEVCASTVRAMSENKDAASVSLPVLSPTSVAGDNTEGDLYDDVIIGGGYSAAEEAVYLTQFADHVTVLVRGHGFTCAAQVAEKCMRHPKIDVRFDTVLEAVGSYPDGESADDGSVGDGGLRWARLRDRTTGETTEYHARRGMTFGVFVFAGFVPNTTLVRDFVDLDERGYIRAEAKRRTNVPGVYAAGDVCAKDLR
nr:FAD-dependent oxidoreductase [Bifidobacterium callitrichos]